MINSLSIKTRLLKRRHAAEIRFQWYGRIAIFVALGFLFVMLITILAGGYSATTQTQVAIEIELQEEDFDRENLNSARYGGMLKSALRARFPEAKSRKDKKRLYNLVSSYGEYQIRDLVLANPGVIGTTQKIWFFASDDVDMFVKGNIDGDLPEKSRRINDAQLGWISALRDAGDLKQVFNWEFLTSGDSREPELAGILSALMGSVLSLGVCFLLSFPIGIFAAIYLEEFAPKNRWSDLIEININNLAAVPSIVFGLLGLAIFLNVFGLPRSSPLVGGMVLSLMTLPTIIIASRASLRSVPPSIREAALGIGASPVQSTFHHVMPLALPGMLTGSIVGMARALGDTAPLLMIGMVAFVVDVPSNILEPATALPVQIFLWADSPERAFLEKTSAAIIVLLIFLVIMNLSAILLRRKYEIRF